MSPLLRVTPTAPMRVELSVVCTVPHPPEQARNDALCDTSTEICACTLCTAVEEKTRTYVISYHGRQTMGAQGRRGACLHAWQRRDHLFGLVRHQLSWQTDNGGAGQERSMPARLAEA